MATIVITSTTSAAQAAGSTSRSLAGVVVGAVNKLVLVFVHFDNPTTPVTGVMFNTSEPLSFLFDSGSLSYAGMSVWYIKNPTATTAAIDVTLTSTTYATAIAAYVISNSNLTTTFRDYQTASGTGTATGTLTIGSKSGDLVIDGVTVYAESSAGMTEGAGQTEKYNFVTATGEVAGSSKSAAGTTTGMSYSWTDSIVFSHASLSILDVADTGGGTGNLKFFRNPLGDSNI